MVFLYYYQNEKTHQFDSLQVGQTYYIRVYTDDDLLHTEFNICIGTPPQPPGSDDCNNAVALTINTDLTCDNAIAGTTAGATQSLTGCGGIADDDIWYEFVATANSHRVTVSEVTEDIVLEFFTGSCNDLTALVCVDDASGGEIHQLNNLTIGDIYRFRIYTYHALRIADFHGLY